MFYQYGMFFHQYVRWVAKLYCSRGACMQGIWWWFSVCWLAQQRDADEVWGASHVPSRASVLLRVC